MADKIFVKHHKSGQGGEKTSNVYVIGRVKRICLGPRNYQSGTRDPDYSGPRDIGKIRFEVLYSSMNLSKSGIASDFAYPMFMHVKQYPQISEIVYIVAGPDPDLNDSINARGLYYFPPYNTWGNVQHGAFPNMKEWSHYIGNATYKGTATNTIALPIGETFEEKKDRRMLRPFEGDVIIESRFGSSIRFGSTVTGTMKLNTWSESGRNGNPITIIRNGQGPQESNDHFDTMVEDLNKDPSSIYLTNGQNIIFEDLKTDKYPLGSYKAIQKVRQLVLEVERLDSGQYIESPDGVDRQVIPTSRKQYLA